MAKRLLPPTKAFEDVKALVHLKSEQLQSLAGLFATAESVLPRQPEFIGRVAEALQISIESARSVVTVCHFLLLWNYDLRQDPAEFAKQIVDDLRQFVKQNASESESFSLLESIDSKRSEFESLATPRPARLRAQKIRRLANGPGPEIESVRTLCQLRPLFEGKENDEQIVGLVPTVLLEIEATDDGGNSKTLTFGLTESKLEELEQTVKRTKEKLRAIREKYGSELLKVE